MYICAIVHNLCTNVHTYVRISHAHLSLLLLYMYMYVRIVYTIHTYVLCANTLTGSTYV